MKNRNTDSIVSHYVQIAEFAHANEASNNARNRHIYRIMQQRTHNEIIFSCGQVGAGEMRKIKMHEVCMKYVTRISLWRWRSSFLWSRLAHIVFLCFSKAKEQAKICLALSFSSDLSHIPSENNLCIWHGGHSNLMAAVTWEARIGRRYTGIQIKFWKWRDFRSEGTNLNQARRLHRKCEKQQRLGEDRGRKCYRSNTESRDAIETGGRSCSG